MNASSVQPPCIAHIFVFQTATSNFELWRFFGHVFIFTFFRMARQDWGTPQHGVNVGIQARINGQMQAQADL